MAIIPTLSAHSCEMPVVGLGTSQLGNCGEIVAAALKLGYRHIDTAWKYGTEEGVGEGIEASGVSRTEIFLCTKVSHEYLRAADFARSVDQSLKRLRTDYVDLLHVHWPSTDGIPLEETMGALAKEKRKGRARHIGVANFNIAMTEDAMRLCPEPLATLREAVRMLRPGGRLCLLEPNGRNPLVLLQTVLVHAEAAARGFDAALIRGWLERLPLSEVELHMRQALPLRRMVLHYRFGSPRLGRSAAARRALRGIETFAGRLLPASRWSYISATARRGA